MNALEIIAELKAGKSVAIPAIDSMEFIRECERHSETSIEIAMDIDWPKCTLSAPAYRSRESLAPANNVRDEKQPR